LRIAVDARPLAHPHTGIGRYTGALLKHMLELDESHHWFLYSDRELESQWVLHPRVTIRIGHAAGRWQRWSRLWCSQISFSRWARRDGINVFWSPRHHLPLFLGRRVSKVVTVHDLVWKRFPETMLADNLKLEQLLMPRSLARAGHIIAVSKFTANELAECLPGLSCPVQVIHEASLFKSGERAVQEVTEPYFLFVGTLEPRKNLPVLLSAFAELVHERAIAVRLVIVGGQGWGNQNIQQRVRELKLEDYVSQLGIVGDEQLKRTYQGSLALLMPSLYEGFGLPALEAMSCGVPVIASNRGALPEVVGEGGILLAPEDETAMVNAMEALLVDEGYRDQLSERARARAAAFSWESAAAATLRVLETAA
jgi:glycosyltransferase involved in cell wall biosynthesis